MSDILSRFEDGVDAHPYLAFAGLTAVYAIAVVTLSSFKLLWLDELITLHLARLATFHDLWQALAQGADPNPPLAAVLIHASRGVFGERELALRLPAMLGYWLGTFSLFVFLKRRIPATWALGGATLSMCMASFGYAYEARSYGIFYGLCMAAFLCWSLTADARSGASTRLLSLFGMALCLAAGICTNYFAVLAFFPIAAAELVRTWLGARAWPGSRSRPVAQAVDVRIWIALMLAGTPLLAFRPLIARSIAEFAPYAWNKVSLGQVSDSYTGMVEAVLYPILFLLAFTGVVLLIGRISNQCRSDVEPRFMAALANRVRYTQASVPPAEAVGIVFLMAYPMLGYVIASVHGGMLSPRFVIPVAFGFSMAAALAAFRLLQTFRGAGCLFLFVTCCWFMTRAAIAASDLYAQKQAFYRVVDAIPAAEARLPVDGTLAANAPILIPDPLMVLTFEHYAPPALTARVVFPLDFPAIRLYRGDDSPDQNLWAGRTTLYHLSIVPLSEVQRTTGPYLILASDWNWLVQDLEHHRYPVERLAINPHAQDIGGFTPLHHGTPIFFASAGDPWMQTHPVQPIPFELSHNLPSARLTPAEGGPLPEDSVQ